eukprot:761224-Hanusia_phi.AAC.1
MQTWAKCNGRNDHFHYRGSCPRKKGGEQSSSWSYQRLFGIMADEESKHLRSSGELQKQLLAQEIVKLRREVALLRASSVPPEASKQDEEAVKKLRDEIETLQTLKEQTIKNQANVQKAVLNKEILTLRSELEAMKEEHGFHDMDLSEMKAMETPEAQKEIANSLFQRKLFEENFTRVTRDLRKELEQVIVVLCTSKTDHFNQNDLKRLSKTYVSSNIQTTIQISNERIEKVLGISSVLAINPFKVMEEAAQVPVESRLHVETLSLRCSLHCFDLSIAVFVFSWKMQSCEKF